MSVHEAAIKKKAHKRLAKPSDLYKIRMLVASNGERLPLLVDAITGLPLSRANQYAIVRRRPRCDTATIEKELRFIAVFYAWAFSRGIDTEERFRSGRGVGADELDDLIQALRIHATKSALQDIPTPTVANPTWAGRLRVVRDFIAWNLERLLDCSDIGSLRYQHIRELRDRIYARLTSEIPRDAEGKVQGLTPHLRSRLSEIIDIESPENPWQYGLRRRNRLVVELFSKIGTRRGEALKILVQNTVTNVRPMLRITRDRDNVDDPRRHEPRAKTLARDIPMGNELAQLFDDYLLNERIKIPGAKRSPYLFLARNGKPLALNSVNEILKQLVRRHPEFRGAFSPHVLRHTASDLWWAELQQSHHGVDGRREILNYIMGWSPNSSQSAEYPRGEIERAAQEFSLRAQAAMFHVEADS